MERPSGGGLALRKDFLPSEAVAIARALEEQEREEARERQRVAGIANLPTVSAGKLPELKEKGQVRDRLGKAVGLSGRTLEKAMQIVKAAEEEPLAMLSSSGRPANRCGLQDFLSRS